MYLSNVVTASMSCRKKGQVHQSLECFFRLLIGIWAKNVALLTDQILLLSFKTLISLEASIYS